MTESKVGGIQASSFALAVEGPYPLALDRKAPPTDMRDAHPRAGEMPTSSPGTGTEHNLPGHEHTSSDTPMQPRTPEKQRESHREEPLKNEQQGHQERPQNDEEQESSAAEEKHRASTARDRLLLSGRGTLSPTAGSQTPYRRS